MIHLTVIHLGMVHVAVIHLTVVHLAMVHVAMIHLAVVHLAMVHLAVVHDSIAGLKACQGGIDVGFRINEELPGNHHLVARADPPLDRDAVCGFLPQLYRLGAKATLSECEDNPIGGTPTNHRCARHVHDGLGVRAHNGHPGEHVGPQSLLRIGKAQADLQRPGDGIQFRIDIVHDSSPALLRHGIQFHPGIQAPTDPARLALEDLGQHPDSVKIRDRKNLSGWCHIGALPHAQMGHYTSLCGVDWGTLAHLASSRQPVDRPAGYTQGREPRP